MIFQNEAIAIFWFRRDLRIADNAGLFHALNSGLKVLPIFIFDENILEKLSDKSDARLSFIHAQLQYLNDILHHHQSAISTFFNQPLETFKDLCTKYHIKEVYTNSDYEPYAIKRDKEIASFLAHKGIGFRSFKDQVIFEKDEILKSDSKPYTIYTPYMKQWKQKLQEIHYRPFSPEIS